MGSERRRCANSFAGKRADAWEETYGCGACADKGLVCVAVYQHAIELLPLKDAREGDAGGEGYWFKRTDG